MLKLLLLGSIIVASPQPIPTPKPTPIEFKVGQSEYEKQVQEEHEQQVKEEAARKLKEEQSWINGTATAYCNCKDVMNGETGVTTSGYLLDNGITFNGYRILASDRNIPLGTLVDIKIGEEVLHGVVLDRGGAITGNHFDIVYPSRDSANAFGKQEMKYRIAGKVDY